MQPNTWQGKSFLQIGLLTGLPLPSDGRLQIHLNFNFASRPFAYRRLAQILSRSLSAFSSIMKEYLDRPFKAYQCAQYVDDIDIAQMTQNNCVQISKLSLNAYAMQD